MISYTFCKDGWSMDIISLVIGFVIGVIVLGLAYEIGTKKSSQSPPASKHTKKWSISEISNPRIMAEYLSELKSIKKIDLLPYHKIAKDKYLRLQIPYRMGDIPEPTEKQMEKVKSKFEIYGFNTSIGG